MVAVSHGDGCDGCDDRDDGKWKKVGGLTEDGGTVRVAVSRVPHRPVLVALFFWQPLARYLLT